MGLRLGYVPLGHTRRVVEQRQRAQREGHLPLLEGREGQAEELGLDGEVAELGVEALVRVRVRGEG